MDYQPYFHGFLAATAALALEHLTLYAPLRMRHDTWDDARVLAKFCLGVCAILIGCAVIAWESGQAIALLYPIAASISGLVIVLSYIGRWLFDRAKEAAYTRGRLHGLADKGDIHEDG